MRTFAVPLLLTLVVIFTNQARAAGTTDNSTSIFSLKDFFALDDLMTVKAFIDYRKGSIIFKPRPSILKAYQDKGGNGRTIAVLQPNSGPALGVGLKLGPNLNAALSRTIPQWQRDTSKRGKSTIKHYELHLNRAGSSFVAGFGLDLTYQDYEGFYLDLLDVKDVGFFSDSLTKKTGDVVVYPSMRERAGAASLFYVFRSEEFPIGSFMNQNRAPDKSGWSPVAMLHYSQVDFENPDPIFPESLAGLYSDGTDAISGGRLRSIALLPGIAGGYVLDRYYASAVGFWGPALQDYKLYGAPSSARNKIAPTGNLRGSIGYDDGATLIGCTGYKTLVTSEMQEFSLTTTSSLLEVFVGRRF